MTFERISRRRFVSQSFLSSIAVSSLALIYSSCSADKSSSKNVEQKPVAPTKPAKPVDPCEDFTGLTEADLKARQKLGYVKVSPIAESKCQNCQLFLPQKETPACGKCQLFKGPVLTGASCTYWAPQNPG